MVADFLHCTLTGASDDVRPHELSLISAEFPFVEWAILYSRDRAGNEPRYPSLEWIGEFVREANTSGMSCALHLCGSAVDDFLGSPSSLVTEIAAGFDRIQLNFNQSKKPKCLAELSRAISSSRRVIITQHNDANASLTTHLSFARHHVLFDASGGRGVAPLGDQWPRAITGKAACGYAGGLGPEGLRTKLDNIANAASGARWWIDMESRIRAVDESGRDRLDMDAVRTVLQTTADWLTFEANRASRASSPDDLRAQGLTVAVHNDYRQNGHPHTFWLFTTPESVAIKGEGRTDAEALNQVRAQLTELRNGRV